VGESYVGCIYTWAHDCFSAVVDLGIGEYCFVRFRFLIQVCVFGLGWWCGCLVGGCGCVFVGFCLCGSWCLVGVIWWVFSSGLFVAELCTMAGVA